MARNDRSGGNRRVGADAFQERNTRAGTQSVSAAAKDIAGDFTVSGDRIPDDLMMQVADRAFEFCVQSTGMALYDYQREFGQRLVRSIFLEDAEELTALWARQSGKTETIAVVTAGLMVLCPVLAKEIPDERIQKFRDGIHIGLFGPSYNIVTIMCTRVRDRLWSERMKAVMRDKEIGLLSGDKKEEKAVLKLPNGSFLDAHSTNPRVAIEGHTYHVILTDETQDIPDWRLRKSIHPMAAQTAGTIVKIGTPVPSKCEFYSACQRNKRHDLFLKGADKWKQNHFEFDYKVCAKHSSRYAKYVQKEIERLGEESDDFRMSYRLHWILERGQFVASEELAECAIRKTDILKFRNDKGKLIKFTRTGGAITNDHAGRYVAGLDIGKSTDSTVLTVGKVFWDYPISVGGVDFYYTHVANWLELQGDDHEAQFPQLLDFLKNYRIEVLTVDATGRGDPVYERLKADLEIKGVDVEPFVFSQQTKDLGYKYLQQELKQKRLTYPSGYVVRKYAKYKRFLQQMEDLEKTWRGKYMVVEAPKNAGRRLKDAHDDYPDSLMLMVMATQGRNIMRHMEISDVNPFFDDRGRRGRRQTRPGRNGPWWAR